MSDNPQSNEQTENEDKKAKELTPAWVADWNTQLAALTAQVTTLVENQNQQIQREVKNAVDQLAQQTSQNQQTPQAQVQQQITTPPPQVQQEEKKRKRQSIFRKKQR